MGGSALSDKILEYAERNVASAFEWRSLRQSQCPVRAVATVGLVARTRHEIERIKPGHPQQNGRHERMHLTLKLETTRPAAQDCVTGVSGTGSLLAEQLARWTSAK